MAKNMKILNYKQKYWTDFPPQAILIKFIPELFPEEKFHLESQ